MENNMNTSDTAFENVQQDMGAMNNPPDGTRKKNLRWLWIVIAAVVVCGAVVGVLFATGVLGGINGNAGVLALAQYYRDRQEKMESLMSEDQKAIQEGFLTGPFEAKMNMDMKTDALSSLMPIDSIPIELAIKYDMKDLGVKVGVPGFEMFGASAQIYVVEDELFLSSVGGAETVQIETPTDADLDEPMTITDRAKALLPFLPQDDQVIKDIVMQLALAVPNEYTETEKDTVYSPKDDDDVDVEAITTTLDQEALGEVVKRLQTNMEKEDELMDTLQDMIDAFTTMFDEDDFELDDALSDMADETEEIPDIEIAWSVYKRNGEYIGVSVTIEDEDMSEYSYTEMYEIDGRNIYQYTKVIGEDMEQTTLMNVALDENMFTIEGETNMVTSDAWSGEVSMTMNINGEGELTKLTDDRYEIVGGMTTQMEDLQGVQAGVEGDMSFDIELECELRFGDDLDTLEENDEWNAIYDEDWGEGNSLMQGLDIFEDMM